MEDICSSRLVILPKMVRSMILSPMVYDSDWVGVLAPPQTRSDEYPCSNIPKYRKELCRDAYGLISRLQLSRNSPNGKIILAFCTLAGGERELAL